MLQQMRGLAKYIWVLVALVFVGGFLLYETSGLMGRTPVTASTAVAVVNGEEIPYTVFMTRVQNEIQGQTARAPDALAGRHAPHREHRFRSDGRRHPAGRVSPSRDRRQRRRSPRVRPVRSPALDHAGAGAADGGRFDPEKYQGGWPVRRPVRAAC